MFGYFLSLFTIVSFTFGFHDWITGELPNVSVIVCILIINNI